MNTDTNPFGDEDVIFAWKKPLKKDSFNPDEIFCRDEEIALYTNALQDIPNGHDPNNVFIYGPTGVGKTAVTRWMREKLREQVEQTDVKLTITDPINCRHYDTNFQLLTAILNELRPEKENIDTNGLGTNRVFNMVFEEIEEIGGNIVIILDEIDNIPPDARNDFLYDIPRAEANGRIESASIGVIGISNDLKFVDSLEPKVKSTLGEREIEFGPYDATQLQTILSYYADLAFKDGVLDDDVLPLAAAFAGQERGDVRQGLRILEKAGEYARMEEDQTVEEKHVRRAYDDLERDEILDYFTEKLSHQQGLSYLATTLIVVEPYKDAKTKTIYTMYKRIANTIGSNVVSERKFYEFLDQLSMLGLVRSNERNQGRKGGRTYHYEVTDDPADIINAVRDFDRLCDGLPSNVDDALRMYKKDNATMYRPPNEDESSQQSLYQF